MYQNKYFKMALGAAAGIILLTLVFAVLPHGQKSAEDLRIEAAKARIEAMQNDCKTISMRIAACFTSTSKDECKSMQDSYAWFTHEYGWSPDFACSTIPDPLDFGAPKM